MNQSCELKQASKINLLLYQFNKRNKCYNNNYIIIFTLVIKINTFLAQNIKKKIKI